MENTLWKGQLLIASEIANDYSLEKEIRKASGRKELRCPDPECQHPILRYCHGDIKGAFFAHLNNEQCDYAAFDKENTQIMCTVRQNIYINFKNKGYNVHPEVKILAHHYTHLLFEMTDGNKIAVEIGTQRVSANRIDSLTDEYYKAGIPVKWIVLGNTDTPVRENQTFFLKRYLLNESKNKDLLVVNWDGIEMAQYKADLNKYEYNGQTLSSDNYPDTYTEYATLINLTFEGNELSFTGFNERYQAWIVRKRAAFGKKVKQLEEEKQRQEQKKEQLNKEQQEVLRRNQPRQLYPIAPPVSIVDVKKQQVSATVATQCVTYEERRHEILPLLVQQKIQARDSIGMRWIKCEICGAVETCNQFSSYGGINHVNLGVCDNCSRKHKNSEN